MPFNDLPSGVLNYSPFFYHAPALALDSDFASYPGQLKINRVLQSKANIFHIPKTEPKQEKKIIVLSDWSLSTKDQDNSITEMTNALIDALISSGFDVRFWNGKETVKITDIDQEKQFTHIKAAKDEDIKASLAQENKSGDAIFHLDYFELRKTLRNRTIWSSDAFYYDTDPDTLYLSDFSYFEKLPNEIYHWLEDKKFRIKFSKNRYEKQLTWLLRLFSKNIIGIHGSDIDNVSLFELVLELQNLEDLIWEETYQDVNAPAPHKKEKWEKLARAQTKKFNLSKLKSLSLNNSNIPDFLISQLLEQSSSELQEIRLYKCTSIISNIDKQKRFEKLKILDLRVTRVSSDVVLSLLSKSPSLEEFNFLCYAWPVSFDDSNLVKEFKNSFPKNLVKLSLCGLQKSGSFIQALLQAAPDLVSVNIDSCDGMADCKITERFSPLHFSKLTKLIIGNFNKTVTDIPCETIGKILAAAQNLEYLRLTNFTNAEAFHPALIPSENYFTKLEKVHVIFSVASLPPSIPRLATPLASYLKILSLSPQVKEINLQKASNLHDPLPQVALETIKYCNLDNIQSFDCSESSITGGMLSMMLCQAYKVSLLNLDNCTNIGDLKPSDIPDHIVFPNLTEIKASESALRGDTLAKIMFCAPNLTKVVINNCKNLESFNLSQYAASYQLVKMQAFVARDSKIALQEYFELYRRCSTMDCFDLDEIHVAKGYDEDITNNTPLENIKVIKVPERANIGKLLGILLPLTPNVEKIIAAENKNSNNSNNLSSPSIQANQIPDSVKLRKLRVISLEKLSVTGTAILKLIKAADKLDTINLKACTHCADLSYDLLDDTPALAGLQVFSYQDSSLPLATIIKIATNLPDNETLASDINPITSKKIVITSDLGRNYQREFTLPKTAIFKTVKNIVFDSYSGDAGKLFDQLISAAPNVETIQINEHVNLASSCAENLPHELKSLKKFVTKNCFVPQSTVEYLLAIAPNLPGLILSNFESLTPEIINHATELPKHISLDNLEQIKIWGKNLPISVNFLCSVISHAKNLKDIVINSFDFTEAKYSFENTRTYSQLKSITFCNATIPNDLYSSLLPDAVNLEEITVENCKCIDGDKEFPSKALDKLIGYSSLRKISIKDSKLNSKVIEYITHLAENLESFEFVTQMKDNFIDVVLNRPERPWIKLKELTIQNQHLSPDFIKNLPILFPNLQALTIRYCTGLALEEINYEANNSLSNLTKLYIENTDINENTLKRLILGAQQLQIVSCLGWSNLSALNFSENELSSLPDKLTSFALSNGNDKSLTKIPTEALKWLNKSHKTLAALKLQKCSIFGVSPITTDFPNLSILDLEKTTLDFGALLAILAKSPKLNELNLKSLKDDFIDLLLSADLPQLINYKQLTLPKNIKKLDLTGFDVPLSFIIALHHASSLKKLCLSQFGLLHYFFPKNIIDLKMPAVEEIAITDSHLNIQDLLSLMLAAENIKSLVCNSILIKIDHPLEIKKITGSLLTKLENISLSGKSYISGVFIIIILLLSPNLKSIKIKGAPWTKLTVNDIPDDLHLPHLTKFTVLDSKLPNEVLQKLKACAPNIKSFKTEHTTSNFDHQMTDSHSANKSTDPTNEAQNANNKVSNKPNSFPKEAVRDTKADDRVKPGTKLTAKEVFIPSVHPALYRLAVYPVIDISGAEIVYKQYQDKKLASVTIPKSQVPLQKRFKEYDSSPVSQNYRLCKDEIVITAEWQPLASLSANESIVEFYTDFAYPYEIQYSNAENLYYIRATTAQAGQSSAKINFILNLNPKQADPLPNEINELIKYCSSFSSAPERKLEVSPNATNKEVLAARYEQRIGSCQNRSLVFYHKFNELKSSSKGGFNFEVRLTMNQIHLFVEIHDGKDWRAVNLGGYKADLDLQKVVTDDIELPHKQPVLKEPNVIPAAAEEPLLQPAKNVDLDIQKVVSDDIELPHKQPILKQIKVIPAAAEEPLLQPAKKVITEADLLPEFITWKTQEQDLPATTEALFNRLIIPGKKSLIRLTHPDDCLNALAAFSALTKRPYLFIDTADELQWRAPGLKFADDDRKNSALTIYKNFSKLRYFLESYSHGVLFINWSNFSATDMVALHSILDEEHKLEGEKLPPQIPIIGFYADNVKQAYKGDDFITRLHEHYSWNNYAFPIDLFQNHREAVSDSVDNETLTIDLFNSEDWEALLFGAINIHKKHFSLEANSFLKNLADNDPPLIKLHLKNPPWDIRAFSLFWQQALQQGYFILYGREFKLADNFKLEDSSGLAFKKAVICAATTQEAAYVYPLNMHTFYEFLGHYVYEDNSFVKKQGLLQQYQGKGLTLIVTENLPKAKWSQLLTEAAKEQVRIYLNILSGLSASLPDELNAVPYQELADEVRPLQAPQDVKELLQKRYAIIDANKAASEFTSELLHIFPDALYLDLDITHDFGDLFYKINSQITDHAISANFQDSDLWRDLKAGKTIIIEGELTPTLVNALSPFFINDKPALLIDGKAVPFEGQLFFVTQSTIPFAKNKYVYSKGPAEVKNIFENKHSVEPPKLENNPSLANAQPNNISYDPTDLSVAAYEAYKTMRFNKIQQGFNKSPIIFYTGATGFGKTTYLTKDFKQDYFKRTGRKAKIYIGVGKIEAFAAHNDPEKDALLLIDEANLLEEKLSVLKGLNSKKPHLLRNGHYYALGGKKRNVILVGNANEYGGVRQQKEFFDTYAATVECDRPNHAYLYHEILLPQLAKDAHAATEPSKKNIFEAVARLMLTIFDKVNAIAATPTPLLSPRHLHMAVLLFNAYCKQFSKIKIIQFHLVIAAFNAILGDALLPQKRQQLIKCLNTNYGYNEQYFLAFQNAFLSKKLTSIAEIKAIRFSFTPSRYPTLQLLDAYLSLRAQDDFHFGLLLEGNSGIGKSTLIQAYLSALKIDFIQLSLGKNYETDCKTLLDAYYEDKVILIDELNAGGPRYERLINTLIMRTEKQIAELAENHLDAEEYQRKVIAKASPSKSLIIGTQNQLTRAGRQPLSPALKARFTPLMMPDYPLNELKDILRKHGVESVSAELLVCALRLSIAYADFHHLSPKPNLRRLLLAAGVTENTGQEVSANPINKTDLENSNNKPREKAKTVLAQANVNLQKMLELTSSADKSTLNALFTEQSAAVLNPNDYITQDSTEKEETDSSESIESALQLDQELIEDLDEEITLITQKIATQQQSTQKAKRQIKMKFLQELKANYQLSGLKGKSAQAIFGQQEYISIHSSRINRWIPRFDNTRSKAALISEIAFKKQKYAINKTLVNQLEQHAEKIHQQLIKNRHSALTNRRWQKYTALRKLIRLYTQQQLTKNAITLLEQEFPQMYEGFFSHKTKELVREINTSLRDCAQELKALEQQYETIRNNPAAAPSNRSAWFHRNGQYSNTQLIKIKELKRQFIKILKSMPIAERNCDTIKALVKRAANKHAPKLIDFHLATRPWLATGDTTSRTIVNKLMLSEEQKLLMICPRNM